MVVNRYCEVAVPAPLELLTSGWASDIVFAIYAYHSILVLLLLL
jgi:hypothetical protein